MKLASVFFFLILFGVSAIAADAQTPVDPIVLVQMTKDPTCPPPTCYSGSGPLVLPYSSDISLDFAYDGSSDLTTLDLEFTGVPTGTGFSCQSDIYANCATTPILTGSLTTYTILFVLTGGGPPCTAGGGSTCPGFLAPGDGFSVTELPLVSATPEPASIVLFGSGLVLFGGVLRRRWA